MTTRAIAAPTSWPFPGERSAPVATRKPRRPRRTYTYRVPTELRHLFKPDRLNDDGSIRL